jgi:hypothetical protein
VPGLVYEGEQVPEKGSARPVRKAPWIPDLRREPRGSIGSKAEARCAAICPLVLLKSSRRWSWIVLDSGSNPFRHAGEEGVPGMNQEDVEVRAFQEARAFRNAVALAGGPS